MRRTTILVLCVWLAVIASIGVTTVFWRINYLLPHAAWAVVSLATIFIPLAWLTVLVAREIVQGIARGRAVGWWFVGATPVVWLSAYFVGVILDTNSREPLAITAPLRIAAVWGSSVLDIEARWRYPRRTHGQHTILLDDGQTPTPDELVAAMDEHIASMAQLLDEPVPDADVAWVRGSLLGFDGRAVYLWALCGRDGNPGELGYIDRHEAAHSLITALAGPDQDPPFVLVEGWAETQSSDRSEQIRGLAEKRRAGQAYSLAELVEPNWYGRANGPVYWEGGPLVHYLIEHYGPEKFFALYRGARSDAFPDDCRRILGDSWDDVERGFWPWIEAEAAKLAAADAKPAEPKQKAQLEFAESVDAADWQALVARYRGANQDSEPLPVDAAFVAECETVTARTGTAKQPERSKFEFRAVFGDDQFWIYENYNYGNDRFLMSTTARCADLYRNDSGALAGWVEGHEARDRARFDAAELMNTYRGFVGVDPAYQLPLREKPVREEAYRIEQVIRPADGSAGRWKVVFTRQSAEDEPQYHCQMELDPSRRCWITREVVDWAEGWQMKTDTEYQQVGNALLPAAVQTHQADERSKRTARVRLWLLSAAEQDELRQRVEQAAQLGPTRQYEWLRRLVKALAIGWPLVGMVLLGVSARREVPHRAD